MTMDLDFLRAFLDSPAGLALRALMVGTLLTAVLGIFAALRDGTFQWQYVDSFVRTTVWGKVAPAGVVLVLAYVLGEATTLTAAVGIAGAVGIGLIQAVLESLRQLTLPKPESAAVNTPPTG